MPESHAGTLHGGEDAPLLKVITMSREARQEATLTQLRDKAWRAGQQGAGALRAERERLSGAGGALRAVRFVCVCSLKCREL